MIDLRQVDQWCPRCFADPTPGAAAADLETYMAVLGRAYMVPSTISADLAAPRTQEMIEGSLYLRMLMRNAAVARNDMGLRLVSQGELRAAITQFEEALRLRPELETARRNLAALEAQLAQRP